MSSVKPTRLFTVCTGPVGIPTADGAEIVMPPREHTVAGKEVKGLMVSDMGYFQILDGRGTVVFCAPAHTILWCVVEEESDRPELKVVDGIS